MRSSFLSRLGAVAALLYLLSACAPEPAPPRPLNVLLITADDLGLQLGCYGEKRISTPRLDALAAEGVRFEVAYVAQASCSPSRSAMFTGRYVHSTGQYGLVNGGFALHPELHDKTLPALLKTRGYRTGIIGKLHVAPETTFPFDYNLTNSGMTRRVREVAEHVGEFLAETGDEPFFLMVNFSDPHAFRVAPESREWHFPPQVDGLPENPIGPGPETLFAFQGIDTEAQRVRTSGYLAAVQRLDVGVGLTLDRLAEAGVADDTLVIFVSDHGPPFARGKTTVYEAALRVPFIVRSPGLDRAGVVSRAMVSTVDIAPTILEAVGVDEPAGIQGRSLWPVLRQDDAPWREYLAGEFHFHGASPFYPRRAIRDGRYQLIHNLLAGRAKPSTGIDGDPAYGVTRDAAYEGSDVRRAFDTFADPPEFELYDLTSDPIQFHNLAGAPEHAEAEQRLKQALADWQEQTDDPFREAAFVDAMLAERSRPQQ